MPGEQIVVDESGLEKIQSEVDDLESEPANYEIVTYPADYTLEGLVNKYRKGLIIIPGFQRKFVWSIKQASRLIESFLLGLPVPAIFLYTDPETKKQLVVDGQQRLRSIVYFFEGYFEEEQKGVRTVFNLKGLNEKSPFYDKTFEDLKDTNQSSFNMLNDSVLRAFIIKQLRPEDDTSIYHVFERLNTGGTQLVGQEIRNCIYHGSYNKMLMELNKLKEWREIFGKAGDDKRLRDVELILRFFALYSKAREYDKPMKDFLSKYMKHHQNPTDRIINKNKKLFIDTSKTIYSSLGPKPFHIRAGLNAAVYDSVFVAFAKNIRNIPAGIKSKYNKLIKDEDFLESVTTGTTDANVLWKRINYAEKALFG